MAVEWASLYNAFGTDYFPEMADYVLKFCVHYICPGPLADPLMPVEGTLQRCLCLVTIDC